MPTLTIATSELRRLAGLASSDTSQDTALAAVKTAEQAALEYGIDPDALASADAGVVALLTLGVAETLTASYLGQLARDPAPLGASVIGGIRIEPPSSAGWQTLADALAKKAAARLAPFRRRGLGLDPATGPAFVEGTEPLPPPAFGALAVDAPPLPSEWPGEL